MLTRRRYTKGELAKLLESAGLQLLRATYCNSLLLPLLFARRTLDRALSREGSDVGFLPAPLERLFRGVMGLEAWLVRRGLSLPLGASVVALAVKR